MFFACEFVLLPLVCLGLALIYHRDSLVNHFVQPKLYVLRVVFVRRLIFSCHIFHSFLVYTFNVGGEGWREIMKNYHKFWFVCVWSLVEKRDSWKACIKLDIRSTLYFLHEINVQFIVMKHATPTSNCNKVRKVQPYPAW